MAGGDAAARSSGAGRSQRLPLQRRWMVDLMRACSRTPVVAGVRLLRMRALAEARRAVAAPPSWTALIAKAYSLVAAERPELRTAYLDLPLPRLYVHPHSVATIVVEREWRGASGVFFDQIVAPEATPLARISRVIDSLKQLPIEHVGGYRRQIRFSRLPGPLRRIAWACGLRGSGYLHCRYFGTFSVNSLPVPRSEVVQTTTAITMSLLHLPLNPSGELPLYYAYDHRVLDGLPAARAIGALEAALNGPIVAELRAMAEAAHATAMGEQG